MSGADAVLSQLPDGVWDVPYVGASFPGAVPRSSWLQGANCQLFAYEVLAAHGWAVADLRSDQLWFDTQWTARAKDPQPLDLVLFQQNLEPYGAHVGVVAAAGDGVLHLCKEVGRPVVWGWEEFAKRPRYSVIIGFKRPIRPVAGGG